MSTDHPLIDLDQFDRLARDNMIAFRLLVAALAARAARLMSRERDQETLALQAECERAMARLMQTVAGDCARTRAVAQAMPLLQMIEQTPSVPSTGRTLQ